jgi:hypothetical protein
LAERWKQDQFEALRAMKDLGSSRVLLLKYEEVVKDSESARARIAAFLALPDNVAAPGNDSQRGSLALSWEHWKHSATGPISQARVGIWRSCLTARESQTIAAVCGSVARAFDYHLGVPTPRGALTRLRSRGARGFFVSGRRYHQRWIEQLEVG